MSGKQSIKRIQRKRSVSRLSNKVDQILAEARVAKAQIDQEVSARVREIQEGCQHDFVPSHPTERGGCCQLLCDQDDSHEGAPPAISAICKTCSLSKDYSAGSACPSCLGYTELEAVYRAHDCLEPRDDSLDKVPAWVTRSSHHGLTHSVKMRKCRECGCMVALVDNTIALK